MAKTKYKPVIFLKQEWDNDGSAYLLAHENAADLAEINKEVAVAQYKFDRIVVIKSNCEVHEKRGK